MASWWLIPTEVQDALHEHLYKVIDPIVWALRKHDSEDVVTGALGQALMSHPLELGRIQVDFNYRKFPQSTEEYWTGADGAIVVTITPLNGPPTSKAALFQAKLCKEDLSPQHQVLETRDAARLKRQVDNMVRITDQSIGLFYTPGNIYAIDAPALHRRTESQLRKPLQGPIRLISLETYLGVWLPRCTRGDTRAEILELARRRGAFKHILEMGLKSQVPLIEAPAYNPLDEVNDKYRRGDTVRHRKRKYR
jgi:hypothetical protein